MIIDGLFPKTFHDRYILNIQLLEKRQNPLLKKTDLWIILRHKIKEKLQIKITSNRSTSNIDIQ